MIETPTLPRLSRAALDALPEGVQRPGYDPADLTPGMVHVGVGNFHRAHQAVYLDDLFALGEDHDWGLVGAGVRAPDAAMREKLLTQDCLTTVVELAPGAHSARVTAAMIDFLPLAPDNAPLIARMSAADIRIVSLTVTEGGYYLDDAGAFDAAHPDMVRDAANPGTPQTVFGAILAALSHRRAAGFPPFTVMSCDNLPGNGEVCHGTICGLARLHDPELADWVDQNVAFPNSMVDRITPATGVTELELVRSEFGIADDAPVTCEPFRQWVMEDKFPQGRPAFEKVGVTFTEHVEAYEMLKLRILNAGHTIIAYPSGLIGHKLVHEAMADPRISSFLDKVVRDEVCPYLRAVPEYGPEAYLDKIVERFSNTDIRDTVQRIGLDGSNKTPKFIRGAIRDNLADGKVPDGLALQSALWCRYCTGKDEHDQVIAPNDPQWERIQSKALEAFDRPQAWLEMRDIYGDLATHEGFANRFAFWLDAVWTEGTAACLHQYQSGG